MVKRTDEASLEQRAKAVFDDSVENLDGRTRSALTQARHAALAELEGSRRSSLWKIWAPLSGVAAAAVVAVMIGTSGGGNSDFAEAAMPFEDFAIVADADEFELVENLDFYAWLDSEGALPDDAG